MFAIAATAAQAEPSLLDLGTLDSITAGNSKHVLASGGAIVGNDSSATIETAGSVRLEDGVQADARALNLVNAAESTVANGVNVFDGRIEQAAEFGLGTEFNVTQSNQISQEQRRVASVPFYERKSANIDRQSTDAGAASSSATLNEVADFTDVTSSFSENLTSSSGNVDAMSTLLGQEVQAGRGLAGAGEMELDFVAGQIDFTVGGGVTFFGDVEFKGMIELSIGLPEFSVAMQGAGCAVQNGSCGAEGSFRETTEELRDQSTFTSLSSSESSSSEWNRTLDEKIRAPFTLKNAQAEYIVVDDSDLAVRSEFLVALSGGAQANMRGMNVVNAAGSAVANGVNVARQSSSNLAISGGAPFLNLVQSNVINHSR